MRTRTATTGSAVAARKRRRRAIPAATGIFAVALSVTVGACAPAGSRSESSASGSSTGSKQLVVARTADIDKLDPALATAFGTTQTLQLVYDTLVQTDADGKLVPGLATSWKTSADGKTLTFALRSGVTFHDGTAFDSAAVVATVKRLLDESTGSVVRSNLLAIDDVTAPDASTVVMSLKAPDASLLDTLTSAGTSIVAPKDIQSGDVARKPNGTGPYEWKSWSQGQSVDLTANPQYWGGAPKIPSVEFRVIPDESSILAGMRAGSFGAGEITDPTVVSQVGGDLEVVKTPSLAYHALMMNGRRAPLTNLSVRQAIACAVDRKQLIDTAVAGQGTVTGPITSQGYDLSPTDGLPCTPGDINSAKALLAKSGVATPITLNTLVMTGGYASASNEAQNLQAQLKAIGVQLNLDQQPVNVYVKRWLAADYDVTVALNGGSPSPYLMYNRYFGANASLSGPGGLDSPQIADLLSRANAETDDSARRALFAELQRTLLQQSPWVWTFSENNTLVTQPGVSGLSIGADNSLRSVATASNG